MIFATMLPMFDLYHGIILLLFVVISGCMGSVCNVRSCNTLMR